MNSLVNPLTFVWNELMAVLQRLASVPGLKVMPGLVSSVIGRAVRATIGEDRLSAHYFLFRSRRGDLLKILAWDRDGLCSGISGSRLEFSSCRA
jgi:hypothetical protein